MGETGSGALRPEFDCSLNVEFHGAEITTDAGLLAHRELVERFGLTRSAAEQIPGRKQAMAEHLRRRCVCRVRLFACLAVVLLLLSALSASVADEPRLIRQAGKGALYEVDGQRVVILAGSPEEMGTQHGALLREDVHRVAEIVLSVARAADNVQHGDYFAGTIEDAWQRCQPHIPERYLREIDALADAAGLPRHDARLASIFPELFHCSGFALRGEATAGGELLHGRVLDYMTNVGLQKHAVTFIYMPEGRHAFVNVGYAGFIGSVTGMNEKKVAFGEMGGGGVGLWDGMPMAFLMRYAMEEADALQEALDIFHDTPRTCEYYYVISDGKDRSAASLYCTPDVFETVGPGESHPRLPTAVPDAVLLSAGGRYEALVEKVRQHYGRIDAAAARELMKRPVAMESNLHCVLFAPERLALWVANAASPAETADFKACNQPYVQLDLKEWLERGEKLETNASEALQRPQAQTLEAAGYLEGVGHDSVRPAIPPGETPEMETLVGMYRVPGEGRLLRLGGEGEQIS